MILDVLQEQREKVGGRPQRHRPGARIPAALALRFRVRTPRGTRADPATPSCCSSATSASTKPPCSPRKQEEALLYRDMQTDLVQQLMRRLAAAQGAVSGTAAAPSRRLSPAFRRASYSRTPRRRAATLGHSPAGRPSHGRHSTTATESHIAQEARYGARNYAPVPVVVDHAKDCLVWDVDGREYIDMMSAYSSVSHGHLHPRIVAAAQRQLREGGGDVPRLLRHHARPAPGEAERR